MDDCIRQGLPLPEHFENAPKLLEGLELFYVAFTDLTSCRQVGQTLGAISWMDIQRYCVYREIEGEQADDLHYHIARMDAAYLDSVRKASDAAIKQAKQSAKSKPAIKPRRMR